MAVKRPRIGLLFDFLYDKYQLNIWSGAVKAAGDFNLSLYCFPGGQLHDPFPNSLQRNLLFKMALKSRLDGFIIMSATVGNYTGLKNFKTFYKEYARFPNVSIGIEIENCPSLLVDNAKGIQNLVTHFVKDHGFTRIGFIKGPEENAESKERFRAYRNALARYNLDFNPEMVSPGLHFLGSGENAIRLFFEKRKLKLQAIIADNDLTAIDALRSCKVRGIRVPQDLAIGGFDDIQESRFIKPQLTTVHQPIERLGYEAVSMVNNQLQGRPCPTRVVLPVQLRIRRSCGCNYKRSTYTFPQISASAGRRSPRSLQKIGEKLAAEIRRISGDFMSKDAENDGQGNLITELTDAFINSLINEDPEIFLKTFDRTIEHINPEAIDIFGWYQILSRLFRSVREFTSEPKHIIHILQLCSGVTETLWELEAGGESRYLEEADRLFKQVSWVGQELIAAFNTKKLTESISRVLPTLGIKRFYITEYTDTAEENRESRFLQAIEDNGPRADLLSRGEFESDLVTVLCAGPGVRRECLIIIPLFIQHENLGLFVFEHEDLPGTIYENLAIQMSNALKSAKIVDKLLLQAESLAASNKEKEILLKEVHHRVKNNLQVISSLLHLQCRQDGTREVAVHFKAVQNRIKSMSIIHEQLYKSENLTSLNLKNYFLELVESLRVSYSVNNEICFDITSDDIHITIEKAIPLGLVVNELVSNSFKHAFQGHSGSAPAAIGIDCRLIKKKKISLCVFDNGKGFPEDFDPHRTTSLGMQIVFNIIENQLNGAIRLVPGRGSRFEINIPV
jgi:two-component sensor histidine kinase/DNA-binding LacI/PurR family transcriptional regulator